METYNCLIVEDEPLAAEVLERYVAQVPFLQLKGTCRDAIYAMEVLKKDRVDVLFLDIHLPKLKGLDFIRTIGKSYQVVLTTAYKEYALEGYEHNVVDYLLKPFEFSRFAMAVNKLRPAGSTAPIAENAIAKERAYLFFNVNKKKVKVYLDEILYIESIKEYIRIHTADRSILTKFQLGQVEEMLEKNNFIRVHRSFIVAKPKIDAFSAISIELGGKTIPIGRSYKELVGTNLATG
jgi:DNA-binding LytR/AlgR family response regulator